MQSLLLYLSSISVLLFCVFLWKNSHIFNRDVYKNFGDEKIPWIKNGFGIAFYDPVQIFQFCRNIAKKYRRSYQITTFGETQYSIIKAKDAEKILNLSKNLEKGMAYTLLHPFIGMGLITSSGDKWHIRRRIITPTFHFNILKDFFEIFREESDKLISYLNQNMEKEVDIISISTNFTLNIILESAMGVKLQDLNEDGINYCKNIHVIGQLITERILKPWLHTDFFYRLFGYQSYLDTILRPVHDFTQSIINKRRSDFVEAKAAVRILDDYDVQENIYFETKKRAAMMDTLLQAEQEGLIDNVGIIEETDTFTFAGHDTTSVGMTFTLLLLAHHQDIQEKLYEEIQDVMTGRDELTMDELSRMTFMERVLKESFRIYPPIHYIARILSEDLYNDGILLKKGTTANIYIYDIHHDPEYYPNPENFDPDRFLSENSVKRHHFAFLAFSAGMRNCIGQKYAMLELKTMLAKIISKFKIFPVTKREEVVIKSDIVLRSKNPIKMKFVARN